MENAMLDIRPCDAPLGAEITGIDLAQPLDEATFCRIDRAYAQYGVIFSVINTSRRSNIWPLLADLASSIPPPTPRMHCRVIPISCE